MGNAHVYSLLIYYLLSISSVMSEVERDLLRPAVSLSSSGNGIVSAAGSDASWFVQGTVGILFHMDTGAGGYSKQTAK